MKLPVHWKRKLLITFLVLFITWQFLPGPAANKATTPQPYSILLSRYIPDTVASLIRAACTDCHSNNTWYPWYTSIQPIAWYTARHIRKGKEELNFDEMLHYSLKKQISKLESVSEQLNGRTMPLASYTLLHRDARLTGQQRTIIAQWADSLAKVIDTLK